MNETGQPYALLGNGRVALGFLEAMVQRASPPSLVVLNAPGRQRCGTELRSAAERAGIPLAVWSPTARETLLAWTSSCPRPWLLSVYFAHLLDAQVLHAVDGRAVNLHASLLPWCRGAHTNVWPLVEGSPAGVTLHLMVPTVDAGALLVQREVPIHPWDTAASLYERLEAAALELLLGEWPGGVAQAWPGRSQSQGGSTHRVADLARLDTFDLDRHSEARAFYDLLRARTFPPHSGLRVRIEGRIVEARVELRDCGDE